MRLKMYVVIYKKGKRKVKYKKLIELTADFKIAS
jgi:hypothetical protein